MEEEHRIPPLNERERERESRSRSTLQRNQGKNSRLKKTKKKTKIHLEFGYSSYAVCEKKAKAAVVTYSDQIWKKKKKRRKENFRLTHKQTSPLGRPTFRCRSQAFILGAGRETRLCLLSEIFNRSSESVVIARDGKSVSSHGGQNATSLASSFASPHIKLSPFSTVATRNLTTQQQQRRSNWTALWHPIISTACSVNQAPAALARGEQRFGAGGASVWLSISPLKSTFIHHAALQ